MEVSKARVRMASLLKNQSNHKKAIEELEKNLDILNANCNQEDQQTVDQKSQTLHLLSECHYRSSSHERGLKHIEDLIQSTEANGQPGIMGHLPQMMKGKFLDMMKDYNGAQEQFAKAHNQMMEDKKNGKHVRAFDEGNLKFRYGWALIRSEKDLDKGIEILKDADLKMTNNFDLKIKLA